MEHVDGYRVTNSVIYLILDSLYQINQNHSDRICFGEAISRATCNSLGTTLPAVNELSRGQAFN